MKKFLSIFLAIMMVSMSFTCVLAENERLEAALSNSNNTVNGAGGGTMPGIGTNPLANEEGAVGFINNLLASIQFIGYAIAIGMLIYVGIKYVMASANEKADLKNAMIKYVIGAILIAGASAIAGWIIEIGLSA